ncbi:MAG: histidine kinase dimerization/phospho-acceptor domain-containing protein [Pseudomonadota bacterium]
MFDDMDTQCSRPDERLDRICECMETGMLVVGEDGRLLFANRAAASLLRPTRDLLDGNVHDLFPHADFLFSETAVRHRGRGRIALHDGRERSVEFITELICSWRLILVWDSGNAEHQRDRRNRAEHLSVMRQLVARLSHELKNPLASLLAGLQTLETGSSLSPDDLFIVKLLLEEVRAVNLIVKGLVDSVRP